MESLYSWSNCHKNLYYQVILVGVLTSSDIFWECPFAFIAQNLSPRIFLSFEFYCETLWQMTPTILKQLLQKNTIRWNIFPVRKRDKTGSQTCNKKKKTLIQLNEFNVSQILSSVATSHHLSMAALNISGNSLQTCACVTEMSIMHLTWFIRTHSELLSKMIFTS